jgi:hypothetical protein
MSEDLREQKIRNRLESGQYMVRDGIVVCSTCGGNCGQCGYTDTLGNIPFDFQFMINNVYGRPKKSLYQRLKDWLL